ncbi:MAG: zinc-binding dehydrogenase [Lentisphaeria bacterium]|jgi:2-desacetyl-2-hydroxyethyl bacteriochlorophyllide A dehydrogenase|nr:zinc-binding dehydrogenase [Lentisphaeria bacterium]MDP7743277.1 zinc-binding dehydrogenase [Lentisphaeria bacterium]
MTSTNIVLTGKQQVAICNEDVPELSPGRLLVRTRVSLISTGTESICYRGEMDDGTHWHNWVQHPFHLGYSNVAEVEAVGDGVAGFEIGDRIFSGSPHHQLLMVDADQAFRIPDDISDEAAAWSKLAMIAQTGVRRAELAMGANVVIIGAGPLGQLLTQYVMVMGARQLLVVDPAESRLAMAQAHGATEVFCGSAADAATFVGDHTNGDLADVVFEATGNHAVFPMALPLVRQFGTLMLIGDSPVPSKQVLTADIITRQISVRGTHNESLEPGIATWSGAQQIELFYTYLQRHQMRVSDLITSRHAPDEAPAVYAKLMNDRADTVGVLFDWRGN